MYECESGRKMSTWEIVLIALGSPLWVPLLIAALAVVFSLYVSLWSVIISFFAVQASLLAVAFGTILPGIVFLFSENSVSGVAMIGAGLVCVGLSIFFFFACKAVTQKTCLLTKKLALYIKHRMTKKEAE